jgi:hypothetical protein
MYLHHHLHIHPHIYIYIIQILSLHICILVNKYVHTMMLMLKWRYIQYVCMFICLNIVRICRQWYTYVYIHFYAHMYGTHVSVWQPSRDEPLLRSSLLAGGRGDPHCHIGKQEVGTYIYSLLYMYTHWAPGSTSSWNFTAVNMVGGAGDHLGRLKSSPALPSAVPHHLFWDYSTIFILRSRHYHRAEWRTQLYSCINPSNWLPRGGVFSAC